MADNNGESMGGRKRMISQEQFYELCEWLKANGARLQAEKPPFTMAAIQASKALGYQVAEEPIKRAARATKLEWESPMADKGKAFGYAGLREQIESLQNRLTDVTNKLLDAQLIINMLEKQLSELHMKQEMHTTDMAMSRKLFTTLFSALKITPPPGTIYIDTRNVQVAPVTPAKK